MKAHETENLKSIRLSNDMQTIAESMKGSC